ncbi:DNA gyrase subunit A [Mycoplasmopsis agassizii]|uniref:DNA gyrase subunit A n=1 Tax=Mycoplasmopsis agassizii TaxID=33922 RepID=A0ABX4H537_9BACT|nr:DNA gyrase subunit A [Mycoplasmopsis agassizii]PAF55006.1 DNA gyrase subunit A [Mycoplasmopsis agassizii]SMC17578.1 DNA gyrase subunit A [Mycoplasmopsis agassizii]
MSLDNNHDGQDEDRKKTGTFEIPEDDLKVVFEENKKAPKKSKEVEEAEEENPAAKEEYQVQSQIIDETVNGISPRFVSNEMQISFLEYAMSVIVSRALPDARDGLKPVHRRILFGMHEIGVLHTSAHKKSARIVGDVLGKYHPHGDSSVYEAMVRMAQDFSMRYPLVDGHGNFGSIDGDAAAAMRYTEARLSKIAFHMLDGIKKNAVDFVDNYDGSEKEPAVLPARFPNLLVSGGQGIAVGMATTIAPHNLGETIDAAIAYARNNEITTAELMQYIKGPDFPTGGIILGTRGIYDAFETGKGSIPLRSKAAITHFDSGKSRIVISQIPYGVQKTSIIEKIAYLVKEKIVEGISDLRDETNNKGIRVVLEIKRGFVPEVVLNKLFKNTNLQINFNVNMVALVGGVPQTLTLRKTLEVYLEHQKDTTRRELTFDLEKAEARLHILHGLRIATQNIDKVIAIIRSSRADEDARAKLATEFNLSEIQTKAIVDMRLGRLTGLSIEKTDAEIAETEAFVNNLKDILGDESKLLELIIKNLEEIKAKYNDARRTEIDGQAFGSISDEDLIPVKDIVLTRSVKGYVKRIALEEYKVQNRGGVGVRTAKTYDDDDISDILPTTTHTDLLIFTSFGKVFRIRAHMVPEVSKQAKGTPFVNLVQIDPKEKIVSWLTTDAYNEDQFLLTVTKNGIVKRSNLSLFERINANGKIAVNLKDGDELIRAMVVSDSEELILGSSDGKICRFDVTEVRSMGRTAAGVKGITLSEKAEVVAVSSSSEGNLIFALGADGFGKKTSADEYRKTRRGAKGVQTLKVQKAGDLVYAGFVNGNEDVLVINSSGITIRTSLEQVSETVNRATKGVRVIRLKDNEKIKSVGILNIQKIEEEIIRRTTELSLNDLNNPPVSVIAEAPSSDDNLEDQDEI